MNLRDSLSKILTEWPQETQRSFKNNQLATFLRSDFTQVIEGIIAPNFQKLKIKASAGAGNWANIPWLSIIDERITSSTQDGIYPGYLFRADGSGVYLTLGQGVTSLKELNRKDAKKKIQSTIKSIREQIPQLEPWMHGPLDLRANTSLGKSYEVTNIAAKFYDSTNIPDEASLKKDLDVILMGYNKIAEQWSKNESRSFYESAQEELPKVFDINKFQYSLSKANLVLQPRLPVRFISALLTKPFVILTGLAGSGKTKIAEALSLWMSENNSQYCMVSVGADWTSREPLLGYPNALEQGKYVKPDSGVLDLILDAVKPENKNRPYFLILDEMNMSHVERYFADFLSAMESVDGTIALHPETGDWKDCPVPAAVTLPENLFIIGTVNIDETTYMFSPKVLDRASVIEFRVSRGEMEDFFVSPKVLDFDSLRGAGAAMGEDFVVRATASKKAPADLSTDFMPFFDKLQEAGAEFGYRSAIEISNFIAVCEELVSGSGSSGEDSGVLMDRNTVVDAAIMQKLLPKVHGSRNKIEKILKELAGLCLAGGSAEVFLENPGDIKYPLTYEKLERMHTRVIHDGFTSYAEA